MKAVRLNYVFQSLLAVMFLLASLLMAPGCGETKYLDSEMEASKTGGLDGSVREQWNTNSKRLDGAVEVTYSAYTGSDETLKRSGGNESISVSLSLVEDEDDIRADGTIIMDEETSLTNHPLELLFEKCQFVAGHEGITVAGTGTLTTKAESGTLIQPEYEMTLQILMTPDGLYMCHSTIVIKELNKIAAFTIPIQRTGADAPIAFFTSSWGKKNREFEINYRKKQYNPQNPVIAVADRDILKLNISETEPTVLAGSEFHLPANFSPNKEPMTIDLTNARILSSLLNKVDIEQNGTLDTVDLDGRALQTNYRLVLRINKKIVMETQAQNDCVEACTEKCAKGRSWKEQICKSRCSNTTCVVRVERYTLLASLELDGLNTRTSLAEVVARKDPLVQDTDNDGFFDSFYGARFLLPANASYAVTQATSRGDIDDIVNVSYDKILLVMNVSREGAVTGSINIPAVVSPDYMPSVTIQLGDDNENLQTQNLAPDYSSLEIGTDNPDDPYDTSGWVSTKISKNYPSCDGEIMVDGLLHLSVSTLENGAKACQVNFKTKDNWLRIDITGMEVTHKLENDKAMFTVVESPRQVMTCKTAYSESNQNLFESEINVSVTLAKSWDGTAERINVLNGRVSIAHVLDCNGESVALEIPADAMVDLFEDGFTVISEGLLTLNLAAAANDAFEFQVYMPIMSNISNEDKELSFYLPAMRTGGTGMFIRTYVE